MCYHPAKVSKGEAAAMGKTIYSARSQEREADDKGIKATNRLLEKLRHHHDDRRGISLDEKQKEKSK
jgi:hypothetical protein